MKHLFKLANLRTCENWDYVWQHRFDYLHHDRNARLELQAQEEMAEAGLYND